MVAQMSVKRIMHIFFMALSINPRYTEAMLNLAVLYNDLGQYAEAKKLYGKLKGGKGSAWNTLPLVSSVMTPVSKST